MSSKYHLIVDVDVPSARIVDGVAVPTSLAGEPGFIVTVTEVEVMPAAEAVIVAVPEPMDAINVTVALPSAPVVADVVESLEA